MGFEMLPRAAELRSDVPMFLLSADPARRRTEFLLLAYSPVWIVAVAAVQLGGLLPRWGDAEYLLFGLGCALPAWLVPLAGPTPSERARPIASRLSTKAAVYLFVTMFLQMALGSHLFFRVFGLTYEFPVTLDLAGSALFLYPLTIAYFSTYYTVLSILERTLVERFDLDKRGTLVVRAVLSYATAFAETAVMCNRFMEGFFTYTRRVEMMWLGSIAYGAVFFCTLGSYRRIGTETPLARVLIWALRDNAIALVVYALLGALFTRLL